MQIGEDIRNTCLGHIGRQRTSHDTMAPEPAGNLAIVLGKDTPRTALPPTWHWAYFAESLRAEDTGHDGHERLGLFMPPAPFERRMWAAGTIDICQPLRIGTPATRVTTIADVAFKDGRTGPLCFVELVHEITQDQTLAIRETQTIVYRDKGLTEAALREADDPVPDGYQIFPDTQLIAYSAALRNGHRIHWDRDFCRNVEGYPGLVVHGPLLATLLADTLVETPDPGQFTYRAKAPVFESSPVKITRDGPNATVVRSDGVIAMEGSISE